MGVRGLQANLRVHPVYFRAVIVEMNLMPRRQQGQLRSAAAQASRTHYNSSTTPSRCISYHFPPPFFLYLL